jgi:hypothetical protein
MICQDFVALASVMRSLKILCPKIGTGGSNFFFDFPFPFLIIFKGRLIFPGH